MDKIRIHFDPTDNSLIVWFDEPEKMAYLSPIEEETPGEFHFIKNEDGAVIGMEFQFYHLHPGSVSIEVDMGRMMTETDLTSFAGKS